MTTDESKYESARVTLIFVAVIAVILTVPWWGYLVDGLTEPKTIVVMECAK